MNQFEAIIKDRSEALMRILAMLVAMAGLGEQVQALQTRRRRDPNGLVAPGAIRLQLYRAVLRLLRPVEAATRRLVAVAAMSAAPEQRQRWLGQEFTPTPPVSPPARQTPPAKAPAAGQPALPRYHGFSLFDAKQRAKRPRKLKPHELPRLRVLWDAPLSPIFRQPEPVARTAPPPDPEHLARRLALRLASLSRVYANLPDHARRFARWQAHSEATVNAAIASGDVAKWGPLPRLIPFRVGPPPGASLKGRYGTPQREVRDLLMELHVLANERLDSS